MWSDIDLMSLRMKTKAIMILSTARAGSNYLLSLLKNFTNLDVNWEIFGNPGYNIPTRYQEACIRTFGDAYEENIRKNVKKRR